MATELAELAELARLRDLRNETKAAADALRHSARFAPYRSAECSRAEAGLPDAESAERAASANYHVALHARLALRLPEDANGVVI